MHWQLPFAGRIAELQPTAAREAALAFLLYNRSQYRELVMPTLAGRSDRRGQKRAHRETVARPSRVLERALARGGSIGHAGREEMTTRGR